MRYVIIFICLCAPQVHAALPAAPRPLKWAVPSTQLPTAGVAANAAVAARTATINCELISKLSVVVALTHSAATALTITMTTSVDGGTTYGSQTSQSIAAGAVTIKPTAYTYPGVTGDVTITIDIDVSTYDYVKLVFGATGGGASDLLTVKAQGATP